MKNGMSNKETAENAVFLGPLFQYELIRGYIIRITGEKKACNPNEETHLVEIFKELAKQLTNGLLSRSRVASKELCMVSFTKTKP